MTLDQLIARLRQVRAADPANGAREIEVEDEGGELRRIATVEAEGDGAIWIALHLPSAPE